MYLKLKVHLNKTNQSSTLRCRRLYYPCYITLRENKLQEVTVFFSVWLFISFISVMDCFICPGCTSPLTQGLLDMDQAVTPATLKRKMQVKIRDG